MSTPTLLVGTRASDLALTQSAWAAGRIAEPAGGSFELVHIRTEGDINLGPLANIGGTGVFVTAVRAALVDGRCDAIVHSFKDLPTAPADGIALAAVPVREDPADALCARDGLTLETLPRGATVGTGSPRRAAQVLRVRPDLRIVPIRGNVATRLGKVGADGLDAVVLARAGLARLGLTAAITQQLGPEIMLPAPSQGALAVECRTADADTSWYSMGFQALDDAPTRACATAERALLATLEAGCTAPVGALAQVTDDRLTLRAVVIAPDGRDEVRAESEGAVGEAASLGTDLAREMLGRGAARLLV
ncbi:hydroxymethylbilane synthase [Nakamurella silvestris]|nr:hydroxymethylbilane synthase [Nakamurella silvestris]